jgi:hypothetical protein
VRGSVGGGPPDDGGVLAVAGVAVGEGRANGESCAGEGVANGESGAGEGGANDESCAGDGVGGVGDGAGGGVGGGGVRAGEGGVVSRGERERASSSPPSLNSSTLHCLLAAFLVRLAGGGEGFGEKTGECSDRGFSGRGDSGSGRCVGVGEEAGGGSGRGGSCSGCSDPRRRRARGATLA